MIILQKIEDYSELLRQSKTIAVVGLSPKDARPSNDVARYLLAAGYTIIPVNPGHDEILGLKCYPSLLDIPVKVDIVDIFRNSADVGPIVKDAIQIGTKAVWMQIGVINESAAAEARKHGIQVVMDKCIKIEHRSTVAATK